MKSEITVMKITKTKDEGYVVRIPKPLAEKTGFTEGYVNIYWVDDKIVLEKTFKKASEVS